MSLISQNNFSGGMTRNKAHDVASENTVYEATNIDFSSKVGAMKLAYDLSLAASFPTGKTITDALVVPVHGVKDYVLFLADDGTLYSWDGSATPGPTTVSTVTAGSKMVLAGESVYVYYRSMTSPSLASTVRKRIFWDYDLSVFDVEDVVIEDADITLDSLVSMSVASVSRDDFNSTVKCVVTNVYGDGAESVGFRIGGSLIGSQSQVALIDKSSHIFEEGGLNVYFSLKTSEEDSILEEAFLFNIKDEKSYVPFTRGFATKSTSDLDTIRVQDSYNDLSITNRNFESPLWWLCDQYNSGTKYIKTVADADAHKIRLNGEEYTIQSITQVVSSGITYYDILLDRDAPYIFPYEVDTTNGYITFIDSLIEVECNWVSDLFPIPFEYGHRFITGNPISTNRPETDYTSGTGSAATAISNRLVMANPYFPDVFSTGEDDDRKGFIAWSFIKGDGKIPYSLIPNSQLISPTIGGGIIEDMFSIDDFAFLLLRSGIARLSFINNELSFIQSADYGVNGDKQYYSDYNNAFIFSKGRLVAVAIDKIGHQSGSFKFNELSRSVDDLLYFPEADVRIGYNMRRKIVYLRDLDSNFDAIKACILDNRVAWSYYDNEEKKIQTSFNANGIQYFLTSDSSGDYEIRKETPLRVNSFSFKTHKFFAAFQKAFVRKLDVLYKFTSGTVVLSVIADGSVIKTETLPSKSTEGIHEINLARDIKTRYETVQIMLEGSDMSEDFEFLAYYLNRDQYTVESRKGY